MTVVGRAMGSYVRSAFATGSSAPRCVTAVDGDVKIHFRMASGGLHPPWNHLGTFFFRDYQSVARGIKAIVFE